MGVLPGSGQAVMFTNANWKALAITPATVQNHPNSLNVHSITVSSPVDSRNTLILDHAGVGNPLNVRFLAVASNSAMLLQSSALHLNGGTGEGMSIGGEFNQADGSLVTGQQFDVGYIGPGIYNLTSGIVTQNNVWIGGAFNGVFNQTGGTNKTRVTHLEGGGTYNLIGGEFESEVYFTGGTFRQQGGRIHGLNMHRGTYLLENGINDGTLIVAASDGFCSDCGAATVIQTGGTNLGPLSIGPFGRGFYVLSNGTSLAGSIAVAPRGTFQQAGGVQTVSGGIDVQVGFTDRGNIEAGSYTNNGGMSSAASMSLAGRYIQTAGTNVIAGDLTISEFLASFSLGGGMFRANNVTLMDHVRAFSQTGGVLVISNNLSICERMSPVSQGASVLGGQLIVSNIVLCRNNLILSAGTLNQSGFLTLGAGTIRVGTGSHQFGPLQLAESDGFTNSVIDLPPNEPAVVRFPNPQNAVGWSGDATLTIEHWNGSLSGGGSHQVFFGTDSSWSREQLAQMRFLNPAGVTGVFPATILSSGEIVPQPRVAFRRSGDQMVLEWFDGFVLQSATNAAGPYEDITGATSPYTIQFNEAQRFFRLRQ